MLSEELEKFGSIVNDISVYKVNKTDGDFEKVKSLLKKGKIDVIAFTSHSGAKNFFNGFENKKVSDYIQRTKIASIGPVTAKAIEELGMKTDIMPEEYTIKGLVKAIEKYLKF